MRKEIKHKENNMRHKTLLALISIICLSIYTTSALAIPPVGTTEYQYDKSNRLKTVYWSDGSTISYTYDKIGNVMSVSLYVAPNGDADQDGLTNTEEDNWGTEKFKPDSDNDGVYDGQEVADGTDPLNWCSLVKREVSFIDLTGTVLAGCNNEYRATDSISTSTAGYTVSDNATAAFKADNTITLQPGFTTVPGSTFKAIIGTGE